jgi:hypothetical protein
MALDAFRIEDQQRGRPLGAVSLPEPAKVLRLILHMHPSRNEVLGYEPGNLLVGIDLGIQPSTSRSHRRGAEVQQEVTA